MGACSTLARRGLERAAVSTSDHGEVLAKRWPEFLRVRHGEFLL
jgi:hypothetical protein